MRGFGGVQLELETPNGDSPTRDLRDHLPSLMSSCYPITLKVIY